MRMICTSCGYIYDSDTGDPAGGVGPGVPFEALPSEWVCPLCYAGKDAFDALD